MSETNISTNTDEQELTEADLEQVAGGARPVTESSGAGGGSGKVSLQDIHFTKHVDQSSPKLRP